MDLVVGSREAGAMLKWLHKRQSMRNNQGVVSIRLHTITKAGTRLRTHDE